MYSNNTIRNKKTDVNNDPTLQPKNHTAAKAAAGIIGAALGVAGAHAMNGKWPGTEQEAEAEPQPAQQSTAAPQEQTRHEEEPAPKEEPTHEQEAQPKTAHQEQPSEQAHATPTANSEDNEAIIITSVHTTTDDEGNQVIIAETTIGGRNAVMLANEEGHVEVVGIDGNNDGQLDNDEIVNVSDRNLYINGNSVEVREAEAQTLPATDEPEVKVIAVENNVDMNGQTVDVAAVSMNGQNVIFVDENQNGEVDIAIADLNNNGQIEDGEASNVSEQHIMMPTADDVVQPGLAEASHDGTDDLPDYSNNADITMYDV